MTNKNKKMSARLQQEFESGRLSRRGFIQAATALGVVASAPLVLGARHARASAADQYDYVIIGAGSAGCALAARLAEDSSKNILVIEAGPADSHQAIHVPVAFPQLFKTAFDWDYTSVPQEGLAGNTVYIPRGKVYGGSSSINAMIYMRGHPNSYNAWAKENPGWGYSDLLPYFIRGENNSRGASADHGVGGPLSVIDQRDPNPLSKAMVKAAGERGYALNDDFNSGSQEGFGLYQVTQKDGMRASAAGAYLHPALERSNVTIQGESLVHNLIIEDGQATGVRFESGGEVHEAHASREVILSAGAIGSPQILMLSGIGASDDLKALGISVVKDLPGVGQNLQDHAMVPVAYECTQPVTLIGAETPEQAELFAEGMGLLTSNIGEAGGFLQLDPEAEAPELQFHFAPNYFVADGAGNPPGHGFTLMPGIVGTKSVGSLRLTSADPRAKPAIDPAILKDNHDLEVMVEGIKIARNVLNAPAMAEYRGAEYLPGEAVQTDDQIRDYIRQNTQTIYHPVGTCKMGSGDMAVVDSRLRVHGIKGLRVADASIMPQIINGNTNAVCFVIGEKCADLIREDA
ncbi:GMC family oxidoreductase N-terminal domain-containing protein [uncultured Marinobacter sp.]|uniref:GMC family oxidoreductase n=1 Tax=uncultured Marinobacter sp. TaxID=187379 RepID=UPI0030DBC52C